MFEVGGLKIDVGTCPPNTDYRKPITNY